MTETRNAAINDAAKALGMRQMTRKQLLDKLSEKGYGEEDSLFAADRMEQLKALDDRDYAYRFAQDRAARGFGEIRIRQELRSRGIEPDLIDEAMAENSVNEEAIDRFIQSRIKNGPLGRPEAKKVTDALARKGFLWEDISRIMQKYLEED